MVPEQQPLGQLVESQPQIPPVQRSPLGQAWQARPALPQASLDEPALHSPASQQPLGHEVPSQTQFPDLQRWPAPQTAPVPQAHAPVAEQVSALLASQVEHLLPAAPQVERDAAAQVPSAAQQPFGQLLASHTQELLAQRWPLLQAGPPPHWHAPSGEQLSPSAAVQATQAAPEVPQVARLDV